MIDNFKIIKKILMSETFNVDGFEYQFISVEPYQDWAINIVVNVVLPKKGQSFVAEKFNQDISHIIDRFSTYLGSVISYNEKILVDGRPVPKMGVYITKEDQNEIINALNGNMSKTTSFHRGRMRGGSIMSFSLPPPPVPIALHQVPTDSLLQAPWVL